MGEINLREWQKVKALREVPLSLSGGVYSGDFIKAHKLRQKVKGTYHEPNRGLERHGRQAIRAAWVPEMMELSMDSDGDLVCRRSWTLRKNRSETVWDTPLGDFIVENYGEFGGALVTGREILSGKFVDFLTFGNIVYAIDSSSQEGNRHFRIHEIKDHGPTRVIYSSFDEDEEKFLSYVASVQTEDAVYILAAGVIPKNGWNFENCPEKSVLLRISADGLQVVAEFDVWLEYVKDMMVDSDRMILGMDKVVAIADLETKEITAYTPLSEEAEKDLLATTRSLKW